MLTTLISPLKRVEMMTKRRHFEEKKFCKWKTNVVAVHLNTAQIRYLLQVMQGGIDGRLDRSNSTHFHISTSSENLHNFQFFFFGFKASARPVRPGGTHPAMKRSTFVKKNFLICMQITWSDEFLSVKSLKEVY